MTLITRNVEELTRLESPSGNVLIHVRNPVTHKDHHIFLSDISTGNSYGTWDPDTEYDAMNRVTWNYKIWESLVDNNLGNIPTEGANWTEVSAADLGGLQTVDVSISNPILNMGGNKRMSFVGESPIAANKTISINDDADSLELKFIFTLSAVYYLQWDSNIKMSDALWNSGTKRWTPEQGGTYVAEAVKDNDTWYLKISNPYT